MWSTIWVIARKEMTDNLRDRRSVFNALLSVLLNPILYVVLFGFLNSAFSEQAEQTLELHVIGAENAPNLIAFLDQNNVEILPAPDNPEQGLLSGELDVVLVIEDGYGEAFTAGEPAPVQVMRDASNDGTMVLVRRTEQLLEMYGQRTAVLRLLARGVSPTLIQPLQVEAVDVSSQESGAAGTLLDLLPVIMFTAAFLGGFYMVIDMTAGERERESLEPLLLNPVPRWMFVIGKYLTALTFTTVATFLATGLFLFLLGVPFIQDLTQLQLNIAPARVVTAVLIITPVIFMAVALQMLIASYARNVKEAQTYTQILSLAGFMPALFLAVLPIQSAAWMNFVPTIGQVFLVAQVMRGDPLPVAEVIISVVVTLLVAVVALAASIRLYNREQIALI
ncbi:MAG: ABC transporter permease [Anaerolineales bacterium]|nr:ABC transporter permease [Anaerolineales bacterium]